MGDSLNPDHAVIGDPAFTLTVNGTGFTGASVVQWNGAPRPTTFVSTTCLTAQIPAADVAAAGVSQVTVANAGEGGGTSNEAAFTVDHGPVVTLQVNPDPATVAAGLTITYTTLATDASGNTWDATADTTFTIETAAGGSWADNVYTSANAGDWTVTGTCGGVTGTAVLHVTHAAISTLTLSPDPSTVNAGGTVPYTATAGDAAGNTWDATADTMFSIDTGAGGSWGANVYTSAKVGDWTITGTCDGVTDTAALHVGHGAAVALTVAPDLASVAAGDSVTYTASAADAQGNTWDATSGTTFSVDAAAGGSWADNVYTSANAGDWAVTGDYVGGTDTAALHVGHAAASSLSLAPDPSTVNAGGTVTYTATASDAAGNTWDASADAAFSIDAAAHGAWAHNVYTPATVGDWIVTAAYAGITATAGLQVVHGTVTTLTVAPDPHTIMAGAAVTYTVTATDAASNTWDATAATILSIDTGAGGSWAENVYTSANAGSWTVTGAYLGVTDTAILTVNRPAAPTAVSIAPPDPRTADDLTATATGGGAPGDAVSYRYEWSSRPAVTGTWSHWGNAGASLGHTLTAKGQQWKARACAIVAGVESDFAESSPITIADTGPTAPTAVVVAPASPADTDDFRATATGGADADGDTVSTVYQWRRDPGTGWGAWTGGTDTVSNAETTIGDRWQARAATLADGVQTGWVESNVVEVREARATTLVMSNATSTEGQTTQLTAKLTCAGAPLPGKCVAFRVDGAAAGIGTTDPAGVATVAYRCTTRGTFHLEVVFTGEGAYEPSSGIAILTVNPRPPTALILTLAPTAVTSGQTSACTVVGDNGVDYTDACTYYAQYGAGGSWVDNVYTSAKAGTWNLTAVYNTLADSKPLTVTSSRATSVSLSPATATINSDQSQTYQVTATDAAGNSWTPDATCLSHDGAGSLTGYTYTADEADAGQVLTTTATVDGQVAAATLNVNALTGAGTILAWDKDTQKFYLCSNATNPQTGTEITGSGDYGGILLSVAGLGGTNVTVASADGSTLRVQWYLRSGLLYRAYQYSTTAAGNNTATYDGRRTLVDGTWKTGFWGLTHMLDGGAGTYGSAAQ